MENATLIAFVVGLWVGFFLCGLGAQFGWRKVRRETAETIKRSLEIQDTHYTSAGHAFLSALRKVEGRDLEGAGRELASLLANLYPILCVPGAVSPLVRMLKADIDSHATRSEVLREALARKPGDRSPGVSGTPSGT